MVDDRAGVLRIVRGAGMDRPLVGEGVMSEPKSLADNFDYYCGVMDWLYEHVPEFRDISDEAREKAAIIEARNYSERELLDRQRELLKEFGERCYALSLRLSVPFN